MNFLIKLRIKSFLLKLSEIIDNKRNPNDVVELYNLYFTKRGQTNMFRKKVTNYVKKNDAELLDLLVILTDIEDYKNSFRDIDLIKSLDDTDLEIILENL